MGEGRELEAGEAFTGVLEAADEGPASDDCTRFVFDEFWSF